jgi:hypothetical protein
MEALRYARGWLCWTVYMHTPINRWLWGSLLILPYVGDYAYWDENKECIASLEADDLSTHNPSENVNHG